MSRIESQMIPTRKHKDLTDVSTPHAAEDIALEAIAFKKIGEVSVGSPTTYVEITGLDIKMNQFVELFFSIYNHSNYESSYRIFINDFTNPSDYYSQYLAGAGNGAHAGRSNAPNFAVIPAYSTAMGTLFLLKDSWYYFSYFSHVRRDISNAIEINLFDGIKTASFIEHIYKIRIEATATDGIGIGSIFILTRMI